MNSEDTDPTTDADRSESVAGYAAKRYARMTPAQRVAAARRVRRLLGEVDVDALYGTSGAEATAQAMLSLMPTVGPQTLENGRGLVAHLAAQSAEAEGTEQSDLDRASAAIRWAAGQPGALAGGIPLASPFRRIAGRWLGVTIVTGIVGALLVSVGLFVLGQSFDVEDRLFSLAFVIGPIAVFVPLLLRTRTVMRAEAVAVHHLFLFEDADNHVGTDAATAVTESFLMVRTDTIPFINRTMTYLSERTVYPMTAGLPPQEMRRRHARFGKPAGRTWVGAPEQTPLVTDLHRSGSEHDGTETTLARTYTGGWYVADATVGRHPTDSRSSGDPTRVVVKDRPDTWVEEVLPLFGDRSGLDEGSLRPRTPEQLPREREAMKRWLEQKT